MIGILDADKEGFLRGERSLIQIIGRAARNAHGEVIMYADHITDSMDKAISETNRRRAIQEKYNEEHHIIPKTIIKEIKEPIGLQSNQDKLEDYIHSKDKKMAKKSKEELIRSLEKEMKQAAKDLDFEQAATLRDIILELRSEEA